MPNSTIAHQRLLNQSLALPRYDRPEEVVAGLGAVQAQDYIGATWALGVRLREGPATLVEEAFTRGAILRTHVLRPTWHFVTPADIRWMLDLTAPRVHQLNRPMYRQLELDESIFRRSHAALIGALDGGKALPRDEVRAVLEQAGIATQGPLRLGYILMEAELERLICSGPRQGNQFTYMLLDERVPHTPTMTREEAVAELVRRYFLSHGPAMVQDFAWWSGLTIADARHALDPCPPGLIQEVIEGQTYWGPNAAPWEATGHQAHLLSNYDEYGSYKDRSAILDPADADKGVFSHSLLLDGHLLGTWKRTIKRRSLEVETAPYRPLTENEQQAVVRAADAYGAFLGVPVLLKQGA